MKTKQIEKMTVKDLKHNLNFADDDDEVDIDAEKIILYHKKNDLYSFIRIKESEPENTEQKELEPENTEQKELELTHQQKIDMITLVSKMAGYSFDKRTYDTFVSLYDLILAKKEETDLQSICSVLSEVKQRAEGKSSRRVQI